MRAHVIRALIVCAAIAIVLGAADAIALAHATLDHSTPAANARLETPPRQIDLYFTEPLARSANASFAILLDAEGKQLAANAQVDTADPRHLILPVQAALDAGSYTVFWKSTSAADGGVTLGTFGFTVGNSEATPIAAGGQVLVPTAAQARALESNGTSFAPWLAGGLLGLVLGAAIAVGVLDLRARRRPPPAAPARPKRRGR